MKPFMANSTYSLNIQLVLWSITFVMVVILGWFVTSTHQTTNNNQFFVTNRPSYSTSGSYFVCVIVLFVFWMFSPPTFLCFGSTNLPFFALMVTFCNGLTFRTLAMNDYTRFAMMMKSVFFRFVSIKFGNRLNFLAFRTFFCYGWFRHGFLFERKLCFEPLEGQSLCGSFYCITQYKTCQVFFRNNLCVCQSL